MGDYYKFATHCVSVAGHSLAVAGKPGTWSWNHVNPGTLALLEVVEIEPGQEVLDLGCGTGVLGLFAAKLGADVALVDTSVPAAASARQTLRQNALPESLVTLSDGVCPFEPKSFDIVLSHLPRGRRVQEEFIDGAAWALRPEGRFYFVASTRAGIKSAIRYAAHRFGRSAVLRQKQGYHVAVAVSERQLVGPHPFTDYTYQRVMCDGIDSAVAGKPGVFAWDRLDNGTAALIAAMRIDPSDRVLDLGCGTGLVGLAAARRAPAGRVIVADADIRATGAARLTLEANDVVNAEVVVSDCAYAVRNERFDAVVTNPPFHRGIGVELDVARQFVHDARAVLRTGGRFYLVANRHLPYRGQIEQAFGAATVLCADRHFQVLEAVAT